jgi:hypothetical protein
VQRALTIAPALFTSAAGSGKPIIVTLFKPAAGGAGHTITAILFKN